MEDSVEYKNLSHSSTQLDQSEDSIKDALDRAIEKGDWNAIETHADRLKDLATSSPSWKESSELSEIDSESETDVDKVTSGIYVSSPSITSVDDERINTLESLIEADDWKGLVETVSHE